VRNSSQLLKIRSIGLRKRRGIVPPRGRIPLQARAWLVWIVSLLFVLFQFFLQLSSAEMISGLMKSFSLSASGGSLLVGSYYYIYVLLQSPAGMMLDLYGPRRVLSAGALLVVFGCLLFGLAPNVLLAVLGRLLMGAGAAFAFVGSLNLISKWFPANRFGLMAALAETFGMLGSLVGTLFLAMAVSSVGWRYCMVVAAVISAVLVVLLWSVIRDAPDNVVSISATSKERWWHDIKDLMRNKLTWLNGLYYGGLLLVVTIFIALWAIPFLQVTYGMSLMRATELSDLVFIGIAISGPLFGWLDARLASRKGFMAISPMCAALIMVVIIYIPHLTILDIAILMLALGLCLASYVVSFVISNELSAPGARTTSLGIVNALGVGTAPVFGPVVAWVLDHPVSLSGSHVISKALPYQEAFSVLILCLLVTSIIGYVLPNRPDTIVDTEALTEE